MPSVEVRGMTWLNMIGLSGSLLIHWGEIRSLKDPIGVRNRPATTVRLLLTNQSTCDWLTPIPLVVKPRFTSSRNLLFNWRRNHGLYEGDCQTPVWPLNLLYPPTIYP